MSEFVLPVISEDFKTGQPFVGAIHPSLLQLNDYITRKFKDDFAGANTIALTEYLKYTQQSWSMGKYYLYGQLQIELNTPLTNELLQQAIAVNIQRGIDYGHPVNSMEAASIYHNDQVFHNLLDLLHKYYQHPYDLMEKYRPDGEYMKQVIDEMCFEA
jgi:hypothetical protein